MHTVPANSSHVQISFKERVYAVMMLKQAERVWNYIQSCGHGDQCTRCCWPWRSACDGKGYGALTIGSPTTRRVTANAARLAYLLTYGDIPVGLNVLHHCDNPPCCNPAHLWLGTILENSRDMVQKGRSATGDRNGSRRYPERLPRGDHSPSRRHPERLARGERHGTRSHPEQVRRGETHPNAKLTDAHVREIRALRGTMTRAAIAQRFGITKHTVSSIHVKRAWTHVPDASDESTKEEGQE
jgi:hypothetical protein